jgi:hypothetical protein
MLIPIRYRDPIQRGEITVMFRRWKRCQVVPGRVYRTAVGRLFVDAVDVVDPARLSARDVRAAGYATRAEAAAELRGTEVGGGEIPLAIDELEIACEVLALEPRVGATEVVLLEVVDRGAVSGQPHAADAVAVPLQVVAEKAHLVRRGAQPMQQQAAGWTARQQERFGGGPNRRGRRANQAGTANR